MRKVSCLEASIEALLTFHVHTHRAQQGAQRDDKRFAELLTKLTSSLERSRFEGKNHVQLEFSPSEEELYEEVATLAGKLIWDIGHLAQIPSKSSTSINTSEAIERIAQ